jgi:hypothetical protein
MITDDPETPGYHGAEYNFMFSFEHTRDGHEMEVPLIDLNWGVFSDRDQFKIEFAPVQNDPNGEEAEWGISDLLVGYKYRFLEAEENHGWAVSFYPQIASPTGDESRDLGSGQTELFFPFEFQKEYCDGKAWVNPEIGYNVVLGESESNFWKFGLATGWEETENLELMGEVGAFVFDHRDAPEPDVPFFNLGFAYKCNKNLYLLGSAGRSFRNSEDGTPDFFCQLGIQVLLGKAAEEEKEEGDEDKDKDKGGEDEKGDMQDPEADLTYPSYLDHSHTAGHYHIKPHLVNPAS